MIATASDALQALLEAAAEAGARKAIEQLQSTAPTRWIPIKESPLGYRPTLDLIRTGELSVHGIGHRRYVDREAVDRWMLAHPIPSGSSAASAEDDEIDSLITFNRNRASKRSAAKAAKAKPQATQARAA